MSDQRSSMNTRRLARAIECYRSGRRAEATRLCARVLKDEPSRTEAICLTAVLSYERGETRQALAMLSAAHARHPDDAGLTEALADLHLRAGDHESAISLLRRVTATGPERPELALRLADALASAGEDREALRFYQRILDQAPGHIGARLNLANSHKRLGEFDAALAELEHAVALAPETPDAIGMLAECYEQMNRVEDAAKSAARGLGRWPGDRRLGLVAARCMRRSGQLAEALRLLDGLQMHDAEANERAAHACERGAILDRLDKPALAIEAFSAANTIAMQAWRQAHPGPNAYAQKIAHLNAAFTPELVAGWAQDDCPPPDQCPVFLVGFPRSGTTLLDQVLDSHPGAQLMEERGLIAVLQHELSLQGPFPAILATLDAERIEALRERYYALVDSQLTRQPGRRLIDKLPLNLVNAGLIFRIFPNAQFIFAVRHPADACLSCFMQNFQHNDAMANFFSLETTVEFYAAAMALWDLYRARLPLTVHSIRYEDLVEDFRGQTATLLQFLGLPWDESVVAFHEHARSRSRINTPSYHQVSQPLYTHARFRWLRYREQLSPYLEKLAPWISAFGYEASTPAGTR